MLYYYFARSPPVKKRDARFVTGDVPCDNMCILAYCYCENVLKCVLAYPLREVLAQSKTLCTAVTPCGPMGEISPPVRMAKSRPE